MGREKCIFGGGGEIMGWRSKRYQLGGENECWEIIGEGIIQSRNSNTKGER